MPDEHCTIVTSEGGDRWVYIPAHRRVFYNYADWDGNPTDWAEAQCSWASMTKAMHSVKSDLDNQPIPADLRKLIRRQRQGEL